MLWFTLAWATPEVPPTPVDPVSLEIDAAWRARRKLEIGGMGALIGWSGASAVGGGLALGLGQDDQVRGFGGMTLAWSGVNLAIGVPALVGALRDTTPPEHLEAWRREEAQLRTAFIFNAGLDVGWMALGGILWQEGLRTDRPALIGAGQAALSQGAFLLAFDAGMAIATGAQARRFWANPWVGQRMGVQVGGVF